jgi:hypothetical protein
MDTLLDSVNQPQKKTERRDHYIPQCCWRGFIDPARRDRYRLLWHFDIGAKTWTEKSTRQVGYAEGFYDYATESPELVHPDKTFARLERDFPIVREIGCFTWPRDPQDTVSHSKDRQKLSGGVVA